MAKKTKKARKTAAKREPAVRKPTIKKRTAVSAEKKTSTITETPTKTTLAKGHEWYDDGGNEGLKQRPIIEGGTHE